MTAQVKSMRKLTDRGTGAVVVEEPGTWSVAFMLLLPDDGGGGGRGLRFRLRLGFDESGVPPMSDIASLYSY